MAQVDVNTIDLDAVHVMVGDIIMEGDGDIAMDEDTHMNTDSVLQPEPIRYDENSISEAGRLRIGDVNWEVNQARAVMKGNKVKLDKDEERMRLKEEALALEIENALDELRVLHINDTITTPQKKRLEARNLKKVEMEKMEEPRKKRVRTKRGRRAETSRDDLGKIEADVLMYDETERAKAREKARLDEVMKTNVEEMQKMCVDELRKDRGDVLVDFEAGTTLQKKRGSESL